MKFREYSKFPSFLPTKLPSGSKLRTQLAPTIAKILSIFHFKQYRWMFEFSAEINQTIRSVFTAHAIGIYVRNT